MLPLKWRDFCCQLNYHIQTNANLRTYCLAVVNRPPFQFAWIGNISKWKFSLSMRWMLINNKCNALNDTWTTTKQPLESFIETDIICIWLISNGFAQWKQFAKFQNEPSFESYIHCPNVIGKAFLSIWPSKSNIT